MESNILEVRKILRAAAAAFAAGVTAVGIFSVFVYFFDMPEKLVFAVTVMISSLCVFFCGLVLARNIEKRGFLNGLVLGMIYLMIVCAASIVFCGGISLDLHNVVRAVCILLSAIFGGVIGINAKE